VVHDAQVDENRFRMLAENSADVVVQTDIAGRCVWVSPSIVEALGWSPSDLLGQPTLPFVHPDDRERVNEQRRQLLVEGDASTRLELRYATPDGSWRWMSAVLRVLRDPHQQVVGNLLALRDIQQEVEQRAVSSYVAGRDGLTGLLTRESGMHELMKALGDVAGTDRWVGVLLLDVDAFKAVNDTHGHAAGDRLLVELAWRLSERLRDSDVVVRIGGDEFLVVLTALKDPAQAFDRAQGLCASLALPAATGAPVTTVSAGVVTDDGSGAAADLLDRASEALRRAKSENGNRASR
jgi:diguanylate cyclase (GGDEF)-like protein/PAS domain S-box-containing protein